MMMLKLMIMVDIEDKIMRLKMTKNIIMQLRVECLKMQKIRKEKEEMKRKNMSQTGSREQKVERERGRL